MIFSLRHPKHKSKQPSKILRKKITMIKLPVDTKEGTPERKAAVAAVADATRDSFLKMLRTIKTTVEGDNKAAPSEPEVTTVVDDMMSMSKIDINTFLPIYPISNSVDGTRISIIANSN